MASNGSNDQDVSKLLESFNELSVSTTSIKTDSKDREVNTLSNIPNHSQQSKDALNFATSSSTQRPFNRVDSTFNIDKSQWRRNKPKHWDRTVIYNDFSFRTPFPVEPFIGMMKFCEIDLDKSSSDALTNLTKPERLGRFSCHINADGKTQSYEHDKSSARYLAYDFIRKPTIDVLEGFSEDKTWGRVPAGEMHLLRWVYDNSYDLMNEDSYQDIDFICYTRMIRSIMKAPYTWHDDWIGIATKVRGSIIIDEIDTPKRQANATKQTYYQKASSYAGYKFEEKITRRYDGNFRPTYDQGNRDSFYIVSKMKMPNHTILYANRIDCTTSKAELDKNLQDMKAAQIKTRSYSRNNSRSNSNFFWEDRALHWWIESWLGKIDLIICGEKNEQLKVDKITRIDVYNLIKTKHKWSPQTCVSFLDLVLTFIKKMVVNELTPYRFYCVPGKAIVCQRLDEPAEKYLPSWFINNEEPTDEGKEPIAAHHKTN